MIGWITAALRRRKEEKKKQSAPISVPKTGGSFIRNLMDDAVDMDGMRIGAVEQTLAREASERTAAPPAYVPERRRQDDDDTPRHRTSVAPEPAWTAPVHVPYEAPRASSSRSHDDDCGSRYSSSHSHSSDSGSSYSSSCSSSSDSGGGGDCGGGGGGGGCD